MGAKSIKGSNLIQNGDFAEEAVHWVSGGSRKLHVSLFEKKNALHCSLGENTIARQRLVATARAGARYRIAFAVNALPDRVLPRILAEVSVTVRIPDYTSIYGAHLELAQGEVWGRDWEVITNDFEVASHLDNGSMEVNLIVLPRGETEWPPGKFYVTDISLIDTTDENR